MKKLNSNQYSKAEIKDQQAGIQGESRCASSKMRESPECEAEKDQGGWSPGGEPGTFTRLMGSHKMSLGERLGRARSTKGEDPCRMWMSRQK